MKYLLDTHTWIWWNMSPENLSGKIFNIIQNSSGYDELLLSAISPWEFCKLLEKKRLTISCNPENWIYEALNMPKLKLVPISPAIAYLSTVLPPPFHDDPADQLIVATGIKENATILTKDQKILMYKHINSIW